MTELNLQVPFIKLHLDDDDDLFEHVKDVLAVIRPIWTRTNIKCKKLDDGFTNVTLVCNHEEKTEEDKLSHSDKEVLIVRIYGKWTHIFISRARELVAMSCLKELDCVPQLQAAFENGFIYEFVPGKSLGQEELNDLKIQKLVIKELVKFHSTDIILAQNDFSNNGAFSKEPELFQKMNKWMNMLQTFPKLNLSKENLLGELCSIEKDAKTWNSPVVFCHNDLLPNNIIYRHERSKVYLIDLEYCHPNYQAFDLATYFCEFAGMKEINFDLYPSKDYQMKWLKMYAESYHDLKGLGPVSNDDIEKLYVQVNKFALVSHLYWGIWGLMQNHLSNIDYDYLNFSRKRFEEFERRKEEFLSLKMPGEC